LAQSEHTLALESLLRPRSVALVGASDSRKGTWAEAIFENFRHTNPATELFLVNPNRSEAWGHRVFPNFEAIGRPVDLALCLVPSRAVVDVLTDGAQHGLSCALVYAAQFGEGGDAEGRSRARALLDLRDGYGMRISGPNCMGLISLPERLLLYPAARVRTLQAGPVGLVFQSGGTFQFWLQQAGIRGLRFSYAISSGNELDLAMADYLDFLVEDESTRVIACLAEGIRKPEAFMAVAAKALKAGKPIVMVKSGRSRRSQAAALSHTGALAGDDAVFDAMCRAYGIIRCETLDDMIETCLAFQAGRLPDRVGAAIITYSGSSKGMMLDYADDADLALPPFSAETAQKLEPLLDEGLKPENPLDIGATVAGQPERYSKICQIIAADDNIGSLLVQGSVPVIASDNANPAAFSDLAAATDKPVIAWSRTAQNMSDDARRFQAAAGMPFLQGMPQAVRGLSALLKFSQARRRGVKTLAPTSYDGGPIEVEAMSALLAESGVTLPRSVMTSTPEEAGRAAQEIGFPVVVKIVSPQALHKTEVGGVALGLTDPDAVAAVAEAMARRLRSLQSSAQVDGFLVQEAVSGLELLMGARTDPIYGPVLMVGMGGIHAEVLRDTAIRLLPADAADIREMLDELKGRALLEAYRGKPERDVEAVVSTAVALGNLFLEHRGWLGDIEINPLMILAKGEGVRAVDVRVIPKERQPEPRS